MQGHVPSGSVTPAKLPWSEVKLVRQCQVRQVSSCTLRDVEDSILLAFVSQASIEGPIFAHGNLLVDDLYTLNLFPSEDVFPCHCCKNFHANMHGYCNSHRLSRFHRQFFSRCHLVPRLPQLVIGISGAPLTVPYTCLHLLGLNTCLCWGRSAPLCDILACVFMSFMISFSLVHSFDIFECPESRALLEAFQWSELLLIFLVQAAADIESRALLALIIVSLCLDCIRIVFKTTPAPPDLPILYMVQCRSFPPPCGWVMVPPPCGCGAVVWGSAA